MNELYTSGETELLSAEGCEWVGLAVDKGEPLACWPCMGEGEGLSAGSGDSGGNPVSRSASVKLSSERER